MAYRILIIDDEPVVGEFFTFLLEPKGYHVKVVLDGKEARAAFSDPYHLAVIDLKLPDTDGLTLLGELKSLQPECECIIMTGYSTVKTAVEAMQMGAFDYIEKPFSNLEELEGIISQALERATAKGLPGLPEERQKVLCALGMVAGRSEKMVRLLTVAEKLAKKDVTVLIRGETGTGKELLARFLHAVSDRASRPFMAVNCAALPENLLESELFGYEKGAFTGATGQRRGIFELAHRGTLFLDEIGDASPSIQVKLLRVLETGEVMRIGGEKPVHVDVRILAATNADLEELVEQKRFRGDLFYRLDVVSLTLPPLRERVEDIVSLAEYFLSRHYGSGRAPRLSPEAAEALQSYPWPGNVRELANVMAQVATVCEGPLVQKAHLPPKLFQTVTSREAAAAPAPLNQAERWLAGAAQSLDDFASTVRLEDGFDLPGFLAGIRKLEVRAARILIERALKEAKGHYPTAAQILKSTPRALRYLSREKQ